MEVLIKLNSQTAGRDKLARLLQYLSKLIWHKLQQYDRNGINKFKTLEYQLGLFRKLLRWGRCIDTLYSVLPLFSHPDSTIRVSVILSKISNALFLFADHILYLGRADLCSVKTENWARISNKYWLYSITMNLVRDFYEIHCILKSQKCSLLPSQGFKNVGDLKVMTSNAVNLLQQNKAVMVDTVKNACDFFIPLTALGHIHLSPSIIGTLGVISSLAGLVVLLEPSYKLTPS